jgi:hypothetical protein
VASRFRPIGMPGSRRTAVGGLVLLLLLLLFVPLACSSAPLKFIDPGGLSVIAGPQGTVTYRVALHNQSIIPIQVTGVEAVP